MSGANEKPMSWGAIVGIVAGVALVVGLLLGGLGTLVDLSSSVIAGGVGGAVGVVAANLVTRRRAELARQKSAPRSTGLVQD